MKQKDFIIFYLFLIGTWAVTYIIILNTKDRDQPPEYDTQCVVTRIIDGDTIECDDISIRLLGIDAPEIDWLTDQGQSGTPGWEARQELANILTMNRGNRVYLKLGPRLGDIYGRVLAKIYTGDGEDIQQLMIDSGHATYREIY